MSQGDEGLVSREHPLAAARALTAEASREALAVPTAIPMAVPVQGHSGCRLRRWGEQLWDSGCILKNV